jgi:autotransporter-associated beta strand protein
MPRVIAAVIASLLVCASASASSFTPGDLIVSTYGFSSTNEADQTPTPITLVEYSTSGGSPILTDALPTADGIGGSGNMGVDGEYGSSSEGNIQLSGNGQYLTFAGYSASAAAEGIQASTNMANGTDFPLGTAFGKSTVDLAQSTDTNVPRVAVRVDSDGNVDSSTVLDDLYNTNNPRSVYSGDGSTFYISGQGDKLASDQGIFFGQVGLNTVTTSSTPTGIYNAAQTRVVTAYNNNLYYSIDTSSLTGIWKFSGMPTSSASATRIIPPNNGLSGSSEVFYSPEGFYFANADTLYVADTGDPKEGSLGDGGIQKWTFNGSSWALQYTLTPTTSGWVPAGKTATTSNGESGFAGITGEVVGTGAAATVELFAVSYTLGDDNPDGIYAINDTLDASSGSGETFKEIESARGNGGPVFKGVSFAPVSQTAPLTWNNTGGASPDEGKTWDINTNANWNNGAAAVVYTDGSNVTFNDSNNGDYAVTLNTTVSPGSVIVNNSAGNYTISGIGSIAGTGSLTKTGSGSLTLSIVNTYTGGTNVTAGTLIVGMNGALPNNQAVTISGGLLQLAPNTGGAIVSSLTISGGGTLDLTNNHIVINYGNPADQATIDSTIRGDIISGAIFSSQSDGTYGVGYADGNDASEGGIVGANSVLVAYARYGDTNLDGVVSGSDFATLVANLGKSVTGWDNGDFFYAGAVDGNDFAALAANLGKSADGADVVLPAADYAAVDAFAAANGLMADVPEPATLGLFGLAAAGVFVRRHRSP